MIVNMKIRTMQHANSLHFANVVKGEGDVRFQPEEPKQCSVVVKQELTTENLRKYRHDPPIPRRPHSHQLV